MWFITKKAHKKILGRQEHLLRRSWRREADSLKAIIADQNETLNSTERNQVLTDLEEALNLIKAYQRALSIISVSDPNLIRANRFLEKFNRCGAPNATILEAQSQGVTSSDDIAEIIGANDEFVFDPSSPKTRREQEEDYWGDEAYGSGIVRIEAVPIDEGEKKELGYTRARIRFVDVDAPEYDMERDYKGEPPYDKEAESCDVTR